MINFEIETNQIITDLKKVDNYLDCETIIISSIKKQVVKGIIVNDIQDYLKKLQKYVEDKSVINNGNNDCVNYRYAVGFLHTVNTTPYWHSWMMATK